MSAKQSLVDLGVGSMKEIWWLIEVGTPASYWCSEGEWCSNANHAHRFATKQQAEKKASTMKTMDPIRVIDHMWL